MAEDIKLNTDEMAAAGVNFGHKISKLHPKMKPYISGIKNNVHIFDLEKTAIELEKALKFISKLVSDGKTMIFVSTKIQMKSAVKSIAEDCGFPCVAERWLGGTFTNFETILKRIEYFKDLENRKAAGEFERCTKKEKIKIDKEIKSLRTKFEGIKTMTKLPEAVFILSLDKNDTCAREAKRKGIKIISLCDSNVDPGAADYPIPANDDAISSVKYILDKVKETILNSKLKNQNAK